MLGKPIAESSTLCIPTAIHALPKGPTYAWHDIRTFGELGWKGFGVLELTALPSIKEKHWVTLVKEVDALLVGGGDPLYLCHWMRQSGLADLLPKLPRKTALGGRVECWEYGDDPPNRGGLRSLEYAQWRR